MTIEKISYIDDNDNNIDIFTSDIHRCIDEFCEIYKIDNINNISQSVFKSMLTYVNKKVFKGTDKLKSKEKYITTSKGTRSNYNAYDIDAVNDLLDVFIDLCNLYDKEASIAAFVCLSGIDYDTFYDWRDMQGKNATRKSFEIWKKLNRSREESLSDKLISGKGNPVGVLGVLNHYYNWAGVGKMEERKTEAATLQDVRSRALKLSDNNATDVEQITDNSVVELSDNLTQLEKP